MSALAKLLLASEIEKTAPGLGDPVAALLSRNRGAVRGHTSVAPGGQNVADYKAYARAKARDMFGPGHFDELDELWTKESGWNPRADNPTSSAYGIPQGLTELHGLGQKYVRNPYRQMNWGLRYIADRYKNPTRALAGYYGANMGQGRVGY